MKKSLLLLIAVLLLAPATLIRAQETSTEKNVLKVNTLSLFVGTGSIFYERALTAGVSGQLGLGYLGFHSSDTKFSGLILTPEVRLYPKKNASDGFYVAPYLRYQKFSVSNDIENAEGSLNSFGGGLVFGRQWITNSGFTMDLFFGGHYGSSNVKASEGNADVLDIKFFKGFKPRIGFALGFAF
ncbi:MAG TPA: DUF3575 domain-containing protein [Bacteroidales bacterium]|nr:DUF3575 domain-containing protein [Bacteroidales bacterium]